MKAEESIVTHDLLRIVSVPFGEIYTECNITETPTLYLIRHIKEDLVYVND